MSKKSVKEFVSFASKSIHFSLVNSAEDGGEPLNFDPDFTYALFEEDKIFGYKGLDVQIRMDASSLHTLIKINYKDVSSSPKPDDIMSTFKDYFPEGFSTDEAEFAKQCDARKASKFTPPGVKIAQFNGDHGTDDSKFYEIFKCNWMNTPNIQTLFPRLQVLSLFFIEAATLFGDEDEDDRWEIMLVYEKDSSSGDPVYTAVGYLTAYAFYHYPDSLRMRIAQFMILPPFQGKGIGSELYRRAFNHYLIQSNVMEICVEDPAEAFIRLRDKCDIQFCLQKNLLKPFKLPDACSTAALTPLRTKYKFSKRQMRKLLEIYLLKMSKSPFDMMDYRLFVKRYIFLENKEALLQMEEEERKVKLEEIYKWKLDEYQEILDII